MPPNSATNPIRVLLADDHAVVRKGIRDFLLEEPDIEGILHLLGVSIVLALPFRRLAWANRLLCVVFVVAGAVAKYVDATTLWLVPFGFTPAAYAPLDYFPLALWFGV